jgi:hypothetical protein
MEKEDLIAGKCYWFDYGDHAFIGIAQGNGTDFLLQHMSLKTKAIYNNKKDGPEKNHFTMNSAIYKCRLATFNERAWLEACIKAGQYLEERDVRNSLYQIY